MTHIRQRRDTSGNWSAVNPILRLGEVGWETDTNWAKRGDGVTEWNDLDYAIQSQSVLSVAGKTGHVVLDKNDVGLGAVDNTPDSNKPVSTAQQAALNLKAPLASPTFTGDPKAPTPATADNDTSIATTAFVKAQAYAPLASPALTGTPTAPNPVVATDNTVIATTKYVKDVVGRWTNYTPSWIGSVTNPSIGNGTLFGRYRLSEKLVTGRVRIATGSTSTFGSGAYSITLPFPAAATNGLQFGIGEATIGGAAYQLFARIADGGSSLLLYCDPTTAGASLRAVTPTTPGTFASGHWITISFQYEAA